MNATREDRGTGKYDAAQAMLLPYKRGGYGGSHWAFEGVPAKVLHTILALHPELGEDAQNMAPTFAEMLAGVGDEEGVTFHGYCITAERSDERITLEGFNAAKDNCYDLCGDLGWQPDELDRDRAWWD